MRFLMCRRFRRGVPSTWSPEYAKQEQIRDSFIAIRFRFWVTEILVETPLVGRHQLRNVALAIAAAVELNQQGFGGITARPLSAAFARRAGRGGFR